MPELRKNSGVEADVEIQPHQSGDALQVRTARGGEMDMARRTAGYDEGGGNGKMARMIDADKLKAHYSWWKDGTREMTMGEAKDIFDEIVDMQPTAERHAHWEWDDELGANVCSSCGRPTYDSHDEYVEFMGSKVLALMSPHYCGYCGARMDEEEDDD